MKYFPRILEPQEEITAGFRHELRLLRPITQNAAIARELWPRPGHGMWLFFRMIPGRIIKAGRDGRPFGEKASTTSGPVVG